MLVRSFEVVPGYDCINVPCQHTPKGEHGICGERWVYRLTSEDGLVVAEMTVRTDLYPTTSSHRKEPPDGVEGAYFSLHVGFPVLEPAMYDNAAKIVRPAQACIYTSTGSCWDRDFGALWPRDRFVEYGDPRQQMQPETFWAWMAQVIAEERDKLLAHRVDPADDRVRLEAWLEETAGIDQHQIVSIASRGAVSLGDVRRWLTDGVEQVTHRQVISTVTWNGPTEPAVVGDPVDVIALELPGVAAHLNTCSECGVETERLCAFYDVQHVPGWSFRCFPCAGKGLQR